ncbi:thiamine diphosphokinase [Carnobacteriaceae bacterium zg-C25]|nr:thiamine diphosphokinase [Carnobacteriaceae bacterium zg-C25]
MGVKMTFYAGNKLPFCQQFNEYDFDVLIGVDGGAKLLIDHGYTLDYAIGDFDSVTVQNATEVVVLPAEKDDTDLQYALSYMIEQYGWENIDEINIFGALNGKRLDHTLCNVWLVFEERFFNVLHKIKLIDDTNTMQFLLPGKHVLTKQADKRYLSFISVEPIQHLTLKNVKYPLLERDLQQSVAYISNEFVDETMCVSFSKGKIIVLQTKD